MNEPRYFDCRGEKPRELEHWDAHTENVMEPDRHVTVIFHEDGIPMLLAGLGSTPAALGELHARIGRGEFDE